MHYRAEIDGLRTVAVVSVLIYHAKFSFGEKNILTGGFLGVDIFFVISGFLITSLIFEEWTRTGHFSVTSFYERRARRLLPALFVVIFASWPFAWAFLMPSHMIDFAKSQLASVFFVSNIYWWDAGLTYGARSGLLEPFLHTWSLAVEEQFYILFPLFLLVLLRLVRSDRAILGLMLFAILAGLALADALSQRSWTLSFYGLQSRVWELLAGAWLAYLLARFPEACRTVTALRVLPPLGFVLILLPMGFMQVQWHHPGLGTVASVVGTVLVIWFANPRDPVTRLLSSRVFVAIGLISYSLYLWHYPIFAFGRIIEDTPSVLSKMIWLALSFLLAFASYRLVEQPFRNRNLLPTRKLAVSVGAMAAATVTFCAVMLVTDGLRERFPRLIALYGINEFDNRVLAERSWTPLERIAEEHGYGPSAAHVPSTFEADVLWSDPESELHKILLVGNSHSKDLFNALHLNQEHFPEFEFARFAMHNHLREPQIATLIEAPNFVAADTILISFRYRAETISKLPAFIERLQDFDKEIILSLNTVEFRPISGMPVFDWVKQQSDRPYSSDAVNELAWNNRDLDRVTPVNAELRKIADGLGIEARNKDEFICEELSKTCNAVTDDGYKSFYDYGHYTLDGAQFFGRRIAESGWLDLNVSGAEARSVQEN